MVCPIAASAAAISFALGWVPALAQTGRNTRLTLPWPKELPKDWNHRTARWRLHRRAGPHLRVNRRNITDEEKETSTSAPRSSSSDIEGNVVGSWGDQNTVPNSTTAASLTATRSLCGGNSDGIVQKYAPDGKLLLQIGTRGKFDSVDGTRRGKGSTPRTTSFTCPRHRGRSRQWRHLHFRRLRQPPRRGVRQVRQVPAPVGPAVHRRGNRRNNVPGVFAEVVHCIAMSNAG